MTDRPPPPIPADEPPESPPDGSPAGLSSYLAALAGQVGYDLDPDELDPVTGFHPGLVVAWVLAGARHAGLAHAHRLLDAPIDFLREQDNPADAEDGLHACLLADLRRVRDRLDRDLPAAAGGYAAACRALAGTGLGLLWPRQAHAADCDPPGGQPPPGPPPAG
jgi:hypothetical protein